MVTRIAEYNSKNAQINYIAQGGNQSYFFSESLQQTVHALSSILDPESHIKIFADATLKTNKMPNGIAIISDLSQGLLIPTLLRDPGCGFLTFKIDSPDSALPVWQQKVAAVIHDTINNESFLTKKRQIINDEIDLEQALFYGLNAIANRLESVNPFFSVGFMVEQNLVCLNPQEIFELKNDWFNVTNTVEIRRILHGCARQADAMYPFQADQLIGFIHSGCHIFPKLLADRFLYEIARYADLHHIASVEQIRCGYLGVPIYTDLGYQYFNWLKAAMNFALVNRYLIYAELKQRLSQECNCQIEIMNDVIHAGVFLQMQQGKEKVISTRGAQLVYADNQANYNTNLRLIAGQLEGVALLVRGGSCIEAHDNLIQHGTSYQLPPIHPSETDYFSVEDQSQYRAAANTCYYNTLYDSDLCLPYSFNNLHAVEYQTQLGLIEIVAILAPFINIHGNILKSLNQIILDNSAK